MLPDAPNPAGLIMQHLTNGPREFKLPKHIFDRFNQRLDTLPPMNRKHPPLTEGEGWCKRNLIFSGNAIW
jgi:hypothetical protein